MGVFGHHLDSLHIGSSIPSTPTRAKHEALMTPMSSRRLFLDDQLT